MKIGYARISTVEQSLDLQTDALEKAGCEEVYTDTTSGSKTERPGLDAMLEFARKGDQIVIWKLDRLGRSLQHLITLVNDLSERGIDLQVVEGGIDTSTPTGRMTFHIFGAMAEFERELIRERTRAGLAAARARGRKGGRKPVMNGDQAKNLAIIAKNRPELSVAELCRDHEISRATFYRQVKPLIDKMQ